jgi:hypothetical protein
MGRKHNVGHYCSLLRRYDSPALMAKIRAATPGLKGFLVRVTLRSLHPSPGVWALGEVTQYLDWCASNGMQLVLQIEDKTFTDSENPLPDYLATKAIITRQGGKIAVRWDPEIMLRSAELVDQVGLAFDNHPNFEGVMTEESSLSLPDDVLNSCHYAPEFYRDAFKYAIERAGRALGISRYFWMQNYLAGGQHYIADILQWAVETGQQHLVMGGPDLLRENAALVRLAYPNYGVYGPLLSAFIQVSNPGYVERAPDGRLYPVSEQADYARRMLEAKYIFWTYNAAAWPNVVRVVANPW